MGGGNSMLAYFFRPAVTRGGGNFNPGGFFGGKILYGGYSMLQQGHKDVQTD